MPTLLEQARQHRRTSRLTGRRVRSNVRFARQQPPRAVEVAYTAWIRGILARAHAAVLQRVVPLLAAATSSSAEASLADRADSAEKPLGELDVVRVGMSGVLSSDLLGQQIREFGTRTERYQGSELQGQIRKALGIESPILSDEKIGPLLREWISENVRLIKTVPTEYFGGVERLVAAGVNTGRRHEVIARQIADRYGVAQRRAALIARDQVGKFYGQVQRARQKELGVTRYRWRTSGDERVRPEHVEREGKVFEWSDPPADGHPGYPINCRCTAEPVITDVLEQLEKEEQADREKLAQLQAGELPKEEKPTELEQPKPVRPLPTGTGSLDVVRDFPEVADVLGPALHVDQQRNAQHLKHAADLAKVPREVLEAFKDSGGTFRMGPGAAYEVALKSKPVGADLDRTPRGYSPGQTMRDPAGWYHPSHNEIVVGDKAHGSSSVAVHELGHAVDARAFGVTYKHPTSQFFQKLERDRAAFRERTNGRPLTKKEERELAEIHNRETARQKAVESFHREHAKWAKGGQRPRYYTQGYTYEHRWDPAAGEVKLRVTATGDVRDGVNETWAEVFGSYFGAGKSSATADFSPGLVKAMEGVVQHTTGWKPPKAKRKGKATE